MNDSWRWKYFDSALTIEFVNLPDIPNNFKLIH